MIRTRRLFLSSLGGVYVLAFVSLWVQVDGLFGDSGILPASQYLALGEQQLGPHPWRQIPTLAWLVGAGDRSLHALCATGVVSGLLLVVGIAPALSCAVAWVSYLSLFSLGRDFLGFQWDILLLECGFLAIFSSPLRALSPRSPAWSVPPPAPIIWLLRLLIAKLMLLSGIVKLTSGDPTWRNLTALAYHYQTTCLPTWTGWYMHQLPLWFHQLSAAGMFGVELAMPLLAFGPAPARLTAALAFGGLMIFIGATGNYGFFNLLAIALCIPLLDDRFLPLSAVVRTESDRRPLAAWPTFVTLPLAIGIVLLTCVPLARALRIRMAVPWPVAQLDRWQSPFQIVNGYGLFANMTTERPEIALEGSDDGESWRRYDFRWKPGDVMRRPQFVEPHMPRLDWQMWFAALGSYRNSRWFLPFAVQLLRGSPAVLDLLANNPFPQRPPRYLRARLEQYRFTTSGERRATGAWWHVEPVGEYLPIVELAPDGRLRRPARD